MKFRDPKTGELFEDEWSSLNHYCKKHTCENCGLPNDCCRFVSDHPTVAARLMGYEVVEYQEGSTIGQVNQMEQSTKPRICEVLGVEVGERFTVDGFLEPVKAFWITENGLFETDPPKYPGSSIVMMHTINHPDRIIRKPRFTQEEVAVLDYACKRCDIDCTGILERLKDGTLQLHGDSVEVFFPGEFFPSIRPGQSVKLADITGATP